MGIENERQMGRDPVRGHLIENLALMEIIKKRLNDGKEPHVYFYRDSNQNEVDIILKAGHELIPVEIKASQTFNTDMLKGLDHVKNVFPNRIMKGFLIYGGKMEQTIRWVRLLGIHKSSTIG